MFFLLLQGPAYLTNKLFGARVTKVFGMPVCKFLTELVVKGTETHDRLLKAGTMSLTVERSEHSCSEPHRSMPYLGPLLDSPRSYHDLVIVTSDGEELKAHKFVLAGL
jgi:hypothetical protein